MGVSRPSCSAAGISYCALPSSATPGLFGHTPSCGLPGWQIRGCTLHRDVKDDIPAVIFSVLPHAVELPGHRIPEHLETGKRIVEIVTAAAQKELLGPGVLSIVSPILVAFAFGAPALGGFLAGAILTGQLMAVFLSNTGGAWDNAKKKIEEGLFGGKGTDCHKAAVIGDTVGDPFKDTAGPAINPMIKVMNLVAILIAPLAIRQIGFGTLAMIVLACLTILGLSVLFSKRGSIVEEEPVAATEAEVSRAHWATERVQMVRAPVTAHRISLQQKVPCRR